MTMSQVPADRDRSPETLSTLTRIARQIFARHGVDFAHARRAGGWSNATWIGGDLALRMAVEPGPDTILREAKLAAQLPAAVGYPPLLETGVSEGYEWMLMQEVRGQNLGACWPTLDWDARHLALCQLWTRAEAVHALDVEAVAPYVATESPFYAPTPHQAAAGIQRLQSAGILNVRQAATLHQALDRFWTTLSQSVPVLNHGDLSIENALWRAGRVVTLLDFEFALIAPVELDLHELVKQVFAPPERADPLLDPGGAGRLRLQAAVTEIAAALATTQSAALLQGYATLLELWSMQNWLAKWDGQESFTSWQPYQTLTSLADGRGGYLAPVLAQISA